MVFDCFVFVNDNTAGRVNLVDLQQVSLLYLPIILFSPLPAAHGLQLHKILYYIVYLIF